MGLYIGNKKVKINLNGVAYNLNLFHKASTEKNNRLLSSDGYTLKDVNGFYLLIKEEG